MFLDIIHHPVYISKYNVLWSPSYTCKASSDISSRPCVRLYLCSLLHTSKGVLFSLMQHLTQSHGMLYTHCFVCWASLTGPVFISVPWSVCLVLKTVLRLKRFSVQLNFSEIPLTYEILAVPWYTVSEERQFRLHYGVDKFFWVYIKHQIMSHIFKFVLNTMRTGNLNI
jgi:hypothetical protein